MTIWRAYLCGKLFILFRLNLVRCLSNWKLNLFLWQCRVDKPKTGVLLGGASISSTWLSPQQSSLDHFFFGRFSVSPPSRNQFDVVQTYIIHTSFIWCSHTTDMDCLDAKVHWVLLGSTNQDAIFHLLPSSWWWWWWRWRIIVLSLTRAKPFWGNHRQAHTHTHTHTPTP